MMEHWASSHVDRQAVCRLFTVNEVVAGEVSVLSSRRGCSKGVGDDGGLAWLKED